MATFSDKISVVIDVTTERATRGLKDFKTAVRDAEGFTGKLKAGVSSLGSQFAATATSPAGMAAGVSAAGAAALMAVNQFSQLGVEVGKFSTATGTTTEEASRLIEVAGDLGINADTLQGALNKLNKSVDPKVFADLGVAISTTSSGATDVNATFLNVVDRLNAIQDPAERARVGTQLLGKSWTGLAEMIAQGSKGLSASLASVSEAKVMSPEEVKKAQAFRDAMQNLKDIGEDLAVTVGEKLAPAFTKAAEEIKSLSAVVPPLMDAFNIGSDIRDSVSWWDDIGSAIGGAVGVLRDGVGDIDAFGQQLHITNDETNSFVVGIDQAKGALVDGGYVDGLIAAGNAAKAAAGDTQSLEAATKTLNDEIAKSVSLQGSYVSVVDSLSNVQSVLGDGTSGWVDQQNAIVDAQNAVIDYVTELGGIPPQKLTEILAALSQGNVNDVVTILNQLTAARTVPVTVKLAWDFVGGLFGGGASQALATVATQPVTVPVVPVIQPAKHAGGGNTPSTTAKTPEETKAEKAQKALEKQRDIEDKKYQMGEISEARYRYILKKRMEHDEKYSDSYMDSYNKLKSIDDKRAAEQKQKDEDAAKAKAAAEKKKKDAIAARAKAEKDAAEAAKKAADEELARAAQRAIVAADISGATYLTINTAADPNAVVNAIQQYNRNNGPAPIKVQP